MSTEVVAEMPRLKSDYNERIVKALAEEFGYKNRMQIPSLNKVVINMGVKEGAQDIKILEQLAGELALIAGQKPVITRAKKSIAGFKIRAGVPIGLKVTLRGSRMFEFVDRLINVAMPRIKDFQGYSDKAFDGRGNLTIGLTEQIIFPEVDFDKVKKTQGMDITFVTSAETNAEGRKLLELFGFPFKKQA